MNDAETIFGEAQRRASPRERAAYLDEACGSNAELRREIEALLAAHEHAGDFMRSPPHDLTPGAWAGALDDTSPAPEPGSMIGTYKLLEQIGEGGMGAVFMAEQVRPVKRRVALKIIKPGMDTRQVIARFDAERQALALMDHPNIAKVFDAGATDAGRPYFVMELVKGVPITAYCDDRQLTPRERLKLFAQVCRAVQHAHQKGIIHRDLKPTNVLVTLDDAGNPVPKVIDFGIAKATAAGERLTDRTLFTEFRQLIGTPLYMSPEQAASIAVDADTRSDVYSLGVLLYELLTGTTPFEKERLAKAAHDEVRRIIREEDPPRPSTRISSLGETLTSVSSHRGTDAKTLGSIVRGELDWIVMRALEKDRTRRYETANGMARDVERYLADEPVEACPPSQIYRFRKFARRHKAGLGTAMAFLVVLLTATIVSSWQAIRATRAERQVVRERDQVAAEKVRADRQAAIAEAVSDFQQDMLASADPRRMLGDKVTVLQAAEVAIKRLDEDALKERPEVEASVRRAIGITLGALSRYDAAEPQFRRALDLCRRSLPPGDPNTCESLFSLAGLLHTEARYAEAEPLFREGLSLSRSLNSPDQQKVMRFGYCLGQMLWEQGRSEAAEPLLRESVQIGRKLWPGGHHDLAASEASLGNLLRGQGKLEEAESVYRESLEMMRRTSPGHPHVALALHSLAGILMSQRKFDQADPLYHEALEISRKVNPPDHPDTAMVLNGWGVALSRQGRYEQAEPLLREALSIRRHVFPAGHAQISSAQNNLADVLYAEGNFADAEPLLREAMESRRRAAPAARPQLIYSTNSLANCLKAQHNFSEAELLYRQVLSMRRQSLGEQDPGVAQTLRDLASVLPDDKRAEAQELLRQAQQIPKPLPATASAVTDSRAPATAPQPAETVHTNPTTSSVVAAPSSQPQ